MCGFGGVHEHRRCTGRGERGGNLARDMPALAHAADDDTAGASQQQIDSVGKVAVDAVGQRGDCLRFDLQHLAGKCECTGSRNQAGRGHGV